MSRRRSMELWRSYSTEEERCERRVVTVAMRLAFLVVGLLAVACDGARREGGIIVTGCVDGQTAACSCSDGRRGSQVCSSAMYGACECSGAARDGGLEDAGVVDAGSERDAGGSTETDAGTTRDAGTDVRPDAGSPRDGGVQPPRDGGAPRDGGVRPPRDGGVRPPRDGGTPGTRDGGPDLIGSPCSSDFDCNDGLPFPFLICEQNICVESCLLNEFNGIPCPAGLVCDPFMGRCS